MKDWSKFIISIITAGGGIGGSWYSMEDRVTKLEEQLAQQDKMKINQMEITQMRRDEELAELKFKMRLDSLSRGK